MSCGHESRIVRHTWQVDGAKSRRGWTTGLAGELPCVRDMSVE
jgi:hypothetical protein